MKEPFLAIFIGIIIAAVSSWITVKLTLGKFRTERWWERKVEAYSKIIESLHNRKAYTDAHYDAELEGQKVPDDENIRLREQSKLAHQEIAKAVDTGAFLLSEKANSRLSSYQKEIKVASECPHWFKYLELDWTATNNCLKDLINLAKIDLKIK